MTDPVFIAGYDAGMQDGKAVAMRDLLDQMEGPVRPMNEVLAQVVRKTEGYDEPGHVETIDELVAQSMKELKQSCETVLAEQQNPKLTISEWVAHARKHRWRFDIDFPTDGTAAQAEAQPVYQTQGQIAGYTTDPSAGPVARCKACGEPLFLQPARVACQFGHIA